jgi:hypothetical protein
MSANNTANAVLTVTDSTVYSCGQGLASRNGDGQVTISETLLYDCRVAIYLDGKDIDDLPEIQKCTIDDCIVGVNKSPSDASTPNVDTCIISNCTIPLDLEIGATGNQILSFSCLWNNTNDPTDGTLYGSGNLINYDPVYLDEVGRDYSLTKFSPCINTGNPMLSDDPDGTRADMGAFPFTVEKTMVIQKLYNRFYRNLMQSSTNNNWIEDDTPVEEWLSDAFRDYCTDYGLYLRTRVVPTAAGEWKVNRSSIVPNYLQTAKDETAHRILSVQWQRCESGAITGVSDDSDDALFASTAHGLAVGDTIHIYDTYDVYGETEYYDGAWTVTDVPDADSFKVSTKDYNDSRTGTWIKTGEGYNRVPLTRRLKQDVELIVTDPGNPDEGDIPQGALFITWIMTPPRS